MLSLLKLSVTERDRSLKGIEKIAQGHTADKYQSQDLNLSVMASPH